jgi:hypothetical protein
MPIRATVYLSENNDIRNKKSVGFAEVQGNGFIMIQIPEEFRSEINFGRTLSFSFGEEIEAETIDLAGP